MVEPTIGGSPLHCLGYFHVYLLRTHKISHLPNNRQQGCMDSLLVTGRGRRCCCLLLAAPWFDDRSMWEPEWSDQRQGTFATSHATSVSTEIGPRWWDEGQERELRELELENKE
jgi:hypothetical protein